MMNEDSEIAEDGGYLPVEKAICGDGILRIYKFMCE